MMQRIIFVIGGPGSGKGTQCQLFYKRHSEYVHLSVGDMVRQKLQSGEHPEYADYIKQGKLLDDQIILGFVQEEMKRHPHAAGFLIDGYPRTKAQIELFENQVSSTYEVLYFDAPSYVVQQRLLNRNEGRLDDNVETIKKRLETYQTQTKPVIDYLSERNNENVKVYYINAALSVEQVSRQVSANLSGKGIVDVGLTELMSLYLQYGNFYDAVDALENRYEAKDFKVNLFSWCVFYIIQNRQDVKKILAANTAPGFVYQNFDAAHGHPSIVSMQTFSSDEVADKNPVWSHLHSALSMAVVNDKERIQTLVDKHIQDLFKEDKFVLNAAFESFMVSLWCEYLFGGTVSIEEFAKVRADLLAALRYTFYDSRLKVIPYLGEYACELYRKLNKAEFDRIDFIFKRFIAQSSDGLINRVMHQLSTSTALSNDEINALLLNNMIPLILEMDFFQAAMSATLAEIARFKVDKWVDRSAAYEQGRYQAYLFPFRQRVAQQDITLTSGVMAKGSVVFINLLKAGLPHSSGPRICIGMGVTTWLKEAIFNCLKDRVLRVEKTLPENVMTAQSHSPKDLPSVPDLMLKWRYSRGYLQSVLPHHEFKGVSAFYDVLKIHENPILSHYIRQRLIDKIKKLKVDHQTLCIATAEVRGIPIAAMVADHLNLPLVILRKPNKIPGKVIQMQYTNAYANETVEISATSNVNNKNVIFIDDGIASGGSAIACCQLLEVLGAKVVAILAMINHQYATAKRAEGLSHYNVKTLFDFTVARSSAENVQSQNVSAIQQR